MLKLFAHIGIRQAKNIAKLILGYPVSYPSLGSMTLDKDDVIIARSWLKDRPDWNNNELVSEYEKQFALWNGSKYAFAFMGGRVALSACIHALDLNSGDEVIIPGYTCVVVPNAFQFAGIKPVYSDIELETYGLDASLIEDKITQNTKAVMLHHLYGLVCRDYEQIINIARKHNLKVIEDCAHSTGAEYKGIKVGNYGDAAFYSSEQSKIFTTIQGGIAVTNNDVIAEKMREYYNQAPIPDDIWIDKQLNNVIFNYYAFKHPQRWLLGDIARLKYSRKQLISTTHEEECGIQPVHYGRKMSSPIAAIGINQLKKIDHYNSIRRKNALRWDEWCNEKKYKKPVVIDNSVPVYLRYPVMVEQQKKINTSWASKELGVQAGVWFMSNIHPADRPVNGCPNADKAVKQCINFPGLLK
ncbi:DegT/DnrJ/EryC1/StrS aminotransferase domain-containing protein [Desulfonema limicola]|uniref:DegT/DnrJ/EryC1/StrS aminotransferase domain-containing protein n=1 Tax=Desulfonema limicola TaxID=45656 RepID=A0A975GJS2_9BACT|nr:aminotransferase class I/II-fold pyridoxal phosphate-dependent enzyme [Desulfonema limicola]QTA83263.1 DegT/DnrJ/EryC1/StrS aminotransferase domain-containing protein [Desulfonema limicola]